MFWFKMGGASSKIEEDKALLLCRERRRFVRQALDGRCALADAHVSYIQALRHTGVALGKFFEPDVPVESSLYSSMSATPEPHVPTDKSVSQFSVSSRSPTRNVEIMESHSPIPSVVGSQVNVHHMQSGKNGTQTIEERPPVSVTATIHSLDSSPRASPHLNGTSTFHGSTMASEIPPWDYFGFFHPIDHQFSFGDDKVMRHISEDVVDINHHREREDPPRPEFHDSMPFKEADDKPHLKADDIRRFRETEDIPELEEEGDKSPLNGNHDSSESEDDFDQPSTEPLVRIFKNRTETMDLDSIDGPSDVVPATNQSEESIESKTNSIALNGGSENHTIRKQMPLRTAVTVSPAPVNETLDRVKEVGSDSKVTVKDFLTSVKEIKELFIKASEAGKQVPRMLEANKINFRPFLAEGKVRNSSGSIFLMAFRCCKEEAYDHEEPITTEVKYSTWNHSVSSLSSSSPNHIGTETVGGADLFSSSCMNSGSHASTLDRLYAWEKKLYDEVKASGIVRKEYDIKCKLLRQQESRCENPNKTDGTRAKVKDSYSRVKVAIHRINSISKTIEELRDKELQPQLEELIRGLTRMWEAMLECHRRQVEVMSVACKNNGVARLSIRSESHSLAAVDLERELNFLCTSFTRWISAQRSYLQTINEWLLKCAPTKTIVRRRSSRKLPDFDPANFGAPPIYITCKEWLKGLDGLPTKELVESVKKLAEEITQFLPQQEKKRGNTGAALSLSRRFSSNNELAQDMPKRSDLSEWKPDVEGLQSRLEVFLGNLQTFSQVSVTMYCDLEKSTETAKTRYESGRWH